MHSSKLKNPKSGEEKSIIRVKGFERRHID